MTKHIKKKVRGHLGMGAILEPILFKKITASLQKPTEAWENNEKGISAGCFLIELGP